MNTAIPHDPPDYDSYITISQAAAYAACGEITIRRAIAAYRRGDKRGLQHIGKGRSTRTKRRWVDAWLANLD